jgi:hypothetical protein
MSSFNRNVLAGTFSLLVGATVWAAQAPEPTDASKPVFRDRAEFIKSMADQALAIDNQECDTLRHGQNGNAVQECRDKALSVSQEKENNGASGVQRATDSQGQGASMSAAPKGDSQSAQTGAQDTVVDKVKNTVKNTWSGITGSPSSTTEEAPTTAQGTGSPGSMPHGMVLHGAGNVAFFCQPVSNMPPQVAIP